MGLEVAAAKQVLPDGSEVCALVAPSARHLQDAALHRYPKLDAIPQDIQTCRLRDLRNFSRLVVVARCGIAGDKRASSLADDLARKLQTALDKVDGGFACESKQDIGPLVSVLKMNEPPAPAKKSNSRSKQKTQAVDAGGWQRLASNLKTTEHTALVVADLSAASDQLAYSVQGFQRATAALGTRSSAATPSLLTRCNTKPLSTLLRRHGSPST